MPKLLNIISNPNPILRKKSLGIKVEDIIKGKYKELYDDMTLTMKKKDGVGLAAPQIAKNIRLIVINTKDGILSMANPKITKKSFFKEIDEEGCLSVPDVYGKVKRNKKVTCAFVDEKGKEIKIEAEGLLARIIQHEIDHLDGILFIDKAKEIRKLANNPRENREEKT